MRPLVENHYPWDASAQHARVCLHWDCARIIQIEGQDVGLFKVVAGDTNIHLSQLQLLPTYQGKGVATFLIQELQQKSVHTGLPITLHVLKSNRAIRLYTRLGFANVQEDQHSFTMRWQSDPNPTTAVPSARAMS